MADLRGLLKELPDLPTKETQMIADHRKEVKELKDLRVMLDPQLVAIRKLRAQFGKGGTLSPDPSFVPTNPFTQHAHICSALSHDPLSVILVMAVLICLRACSQQL